MPRNQDHVAHPSRTALLLIDVINDMDFPGSEGLVEAALPMAERIAALKRRARAAGIPAIYANDNFGRWRSDFRKVVEHCLRPHVPGHKVAELLKPEEEDLFVLKPKHSGFFSSTLDTLLEYLGTEKLILTGVAGNICVLFTANDAYMRDYQLFVPGDCLASNSPQENEWALRQMREVMKADTTESTRLDLERLQQAEEPEVPPRIFLAG